MNLDDDDDSIFEQALRADLPTMAQQNRLRQRILAAGVAASTVVGTTNVAAATQASFGASALSKLSALSWPAKLGLTAALAAPIAGATLPLAYAPVSGAAIVSQVRSSVATVHARAATKALARANLPLPAAPQARLSERESEPEPEPPLAAANVAARAAVVPLPAAAPNPAAAGNLAAAQPSVVAQPSVAAQPSVVAFDSVAAAAAPRGSEQQRNQSTLAAETQLLDRAFAALAAGDRTTASALVAEHARLFPNGLLRQERERARARLAANSKGE